ncbi:putative nuclease HARBI1 [Anthonomus grandis grandis]|uniref:putative nuclease HARBI1 n=1 Tax=Anthonomus grandis grandis TaxID=2921223 RepID=UPI0021650DE5|nr:putative nuclease HARBI1 [Anthonomus grandis grandis]
MYITFLTADPGFQPGVGVDLDVNQSTVSRTLATVSKAIYSKRNNWIKFPNTNELLTVAINEGARGERMPRVIAVIDCTHVKITKPSIHGDEYVNRKGVCSINVQATCNAREMFTSVDASWPDSVHDSRIWRNSIVHGIMYNNVHEAALLGDERYGVAPWLLTPYKNPTTPMQENYNLIHAKERCVIERCS